MLEFLLFAGLVWAAWEVKEAVGEDRPYAAVAWMMGVVVALVAMAVVHQLGL